MSEENKDKLEELLDLINCSDTLREDCDDCPTVQRILQLAEELKGVLDAPY